MNKILAIDTSSEACSVALLINNECNTLFEIAPQAHSQLVLGMCEKLLAAAELSLSDLDGIAYSRGPGSFTGLRIGAGVVQGIAFARDLPVLNISSLQALARHVAQRHANVKVLASIDARMGEVYWAEYLVEDSAQILPLGEEVLSTPEDIVIDRHSSYIGIGSGFKVYRKQLEKLVYPENFAQIYVKQLVSAEDIAFLAANNRNKSEWVTASEALPVYLRNDVVSKRQ